MNKIKKLFANNMIEVKKNVKEYPATYLVTIVITLLLTVLLNIGDMPDIYEPIIYFAGTSIFVYWLTEILLKKWIPKIIGYVVATGVGVVWAVALDMHADKLPGIYRVLIGYIVVLICLCIYFIMKQMNVNSYKYVLDVFQNIFTYTMFYAVLNIGLTSVLLIFINLIWDGDADNLIFRLQLLLLGWFYFPSLVLAFTKKKSHITTFVKNLLKYVLYPITLIAIVIIYVYMFKILILNEIPSNSIYEIVAYIFVYGFTSYIMVRNYSKDNKFYEITTKILPWAFIPLIILQSYSIIVRTHKYGCTISRYLGIVFVIIELVILALNAYTKKDKLDKAFLIIAIIAVIASMSPFNVEKVSVESQVKLLAKEWPRGKDFDDLTEKQKDKLSDRYNYILEQNKKYRKIYIKKYLKSKEYVSIDKLKDYFSILDDKDNSKYYDDICFVAEYNKKIDISKYKKAKFVIEGDGDEELECKEIIKQLLNKYGKEFEEKIKKDNPIKIDDKKYIYIYSLDLYYYTEKDDKKDNNQKDSKEENKKDNKEEKDNNQEENRKFVINSYNIEGLLLEK